MRRSYLISAILAVVAAIVYFGSMASYAFPGDSAHLIACWRGLEIAPGNDYPLMAVFARALGGGNLIAPITGIIATVLVFVLVSFFIRGLIHGEKSKYFASSLGYIAGTSAAVIFMFSPAVREAASHLEPRLFDATWALGMMALILPFMKFTNGVRYVFPALMGAMIALGYCDSALFMAIAPLMIVGIVSADLNAGKKPYLSLSLFAGMFLIVFVTALNSFGLELTPFLKASAKEFKEYYSGHNWILIAAFTTLPFCVSLFSAWRAFNDSKPSLVHWLFHIAMSITAILAIATPLAPSSLKFEEGIYPVMTSAYAAVVAGYLLAYWWFYRKQVIGAACGIIFAFVMVFATFWNMFDFDADRGAFADQVANRVLDDLGERAWFVTDGTLDDHLLIAADKRGKEINLVALQRDLDPMYLTALGEVVKAKGVGGPKNDDLALSLTLGVLPFVQDWFAVDPTVGKQVAIWGAPDIWYSAGRKPVPEFLFFGCDAERVANWADWPKYNELLKVEKDWGSYRADKPTDPVERLRWSLRRYLGLTANNRGVWLQDEKDNDGAFACYERVLNEIDPDNVCALFNEIEMAGQKYPKAIAKKRDLERSIKAIVDDKERRYVIWRLASFYGYIRNPDMFVRLGFSWARSGRPGDALAQIRRAIDFVASDKRSALLNMMAALYASDNDQAKSRRIYEAVLRKNADDHDALIGMMRLELLDGDEKKALAYLERAVKTSPADGKRAQMELAMVSMIKNDLNGAKAILQKITDKDSKDLQAWSFLAAVTMQQCDAEKDAAKREKLVAEIRDTILPEMERQATNPYDYYVQTTKAFLLMRENSVEKRREARAAFETAMRERPGASATQDLVLGLDISLDDRASAERHAREVLRKNRNAPLANYVMGSMAIQRGQYQEAEAFLRKAVNTARPNVLALNDLAEVLRRTEKLAEAETHIRKAIELSPTFYILYETLGVILMDQQKNLEEAEKCINKSIELSKQEQGGEEDVRIYMSLARVQTMRGDMKGAKRSLRKVMPKLDTLTEFEKREFEEIKKGVH